MMEISLTLDESGRWHEVMPVQQFRDSILLAQDEMLKHEQIDCPLKHHFAPGAYAREILLPEGSLVIGKIHRHAHINVISKGRVSVITETGRKELSAPCTFVSDVGTKRAVYAHEDTVWTTIHVSNETDLEKLENEIIAKTYDDLPQQIIDQSMALIFEVKA